jgi:NADPH-dependent glutamate synthase beta subunit-like oxidoreductase/NAD(P)H-flavin reductase
MKLRHHASRRSDQNVWDFALGLPGFRYGDLNRVRRLEALDRAFRDDLAAADPALAAEFEAYRAARGEGLAPVAESSLLVRVAPHLGRFVARLFRIDEARATLAGRDRDDARIFEWKKKFLAPRVLRKEPDDAALAALDLAALEREAAAIGAAGPDEERAIAEVGLALLARGKDAEAAARLDVLERWCRALAFHPALRERTRGWASFRHPHALDFAELVETARPAELPIAREGPAERQRHRDGFVLTDARMSAREVAGEVHYCLYCHEREKDSCSKGFLEDAKAAPVPAGVLPRYRPNPLGIPLSGCPLGEKISEAHLLKRDGESIGALAVVIVDNPMCPGTGHRICNDCMKACIFQKQEPVNIPQIETGILTDVLRLPYGVEIYGLLTRWNPLNARRPYPRRYNGKNVLVVGMGPAGYTLAHHLLQEGFGVVGIDGLKIEPLSTEIMGGRRRVPRPIRDWDELASRLDERILLGFGGVSEYGITVRWDKNFLDLIYLTLMRRKKFRLFGGVRFGGTLTLADAWDLGFDHVALATGAGRPTIVPMKNNLIRGVRKASDFLMGLQLSGAYKHEGLANLQVELPAVVIGGGLTAIDTATELAAYYLVQVEKTLERFERLAARIGEEKIFARLTEEEREVVLRFLAHGRAVRDERAAAAQEGRAPDLGGLVRGFGGVAIVYRKRLEDSPAYRLNHEEVIKALEEGIRFVECLSPLEIVPDERGRARAVVFERQAEAAGKWRGTGERVELAARAVMVAAGTHPNSIYEKEHPGTFARDKWGEFFLAHRAERGAPGEAPRLVPADAGKGEVGFFTSHAGPGGRLVSFYGDNHPVYEGNVVKAMASAKAGARAVAALFEDEVTRQTDHDQIEREERWVRFGEIMDDGFRAKVLDVVRLTPTIVEVIVRAPLAARHFRPGQFYKLLNFESYAPEVDGFRLTMEGIALTGAWVDRERGTLSMIALEMGHSSRLVALLEPGEEVVVMGPTGTPTEIPEGETVCLAGGGLGNAVLFSIAEALRAKGNRVIYFAGFKSGADLFKRSEIEKACDLVVWSVDRGEEIAPRRPQDKTFTGNIVQAMDAYARGALGAQPIALKDVTRIISIGSDRMMNAVRVARKDVLACHLRPDHVAIGSINSPMQCMLKEVCAQCLQKHVDPASGKEKEIVFSCFNQDQLLDEVDFDHLRQRLSQNTAAEKLTDLWLDHLFEQRKVAMA